MEWKREVAMLIDSRNVPLTTVLGRPGRVDFPIEYAWEFHNCCKKDPPHSPIVTMAHTHPPGFTGLSEEDRTTLKAWTLTFAPYIINMDVICLDDGELSHRRFTYRLESLESWRKDGKKGERRMDLVEASVPSFVCSPWVFRILEYSYEGWVYFK